MKYRKILVLLVTWFLANSLTHLVILLLSGKIYYQLSPIPALIAEYSISALNFVLPFVALKVFLKKTNSYITELSLRWSGWRTPIWGLLGFVGFMLIASVPNRIFSNQIISYSPAASRPFNIQELYVLTIGLLIFPALGEELMFRGFLQTQFNKMYGVTIGIIIPAILFALKHHPSDIYFGITNSVPIAGWLNRGVQLYFGAVIFGLVRHFSKSIWGSWVMHMCLIIFILIIGGILRAILG